MPKYRWRQRQYVALVIMPSFARIAKDRLQLLRTDIVAVAHFVGAQKVVARIL